ncbi:hypothetical protein TL16_g08466 [Triparma laevis f. inornata]|uniref:Methyltransferase type 11 domain-containing protein n=1 Tax=Triparma laevis f. inornata TaxID=1714386 RepID=A0A9W7EKF0_9STRA|nr:hypothetical protein TL16_g08466 [Triparma laevis f. inornata]
MGRVTSSFSKGVTDPVLIDPNTPAESKAKAPPLEVQTTSTLVVAGLASSASVLPGTLPLPFPVPVPGIRLTASTPNGPTYSGTSSSYIDLVEPIDLTDTEPHLMNNLKHLFPNLPKVSLPGTKDYVPMQDLFTSPAVSFAYERGWRQGFMAAGFPGVEKEYEMARDFFASSPSQPPAVVVDMSCGSGLFTRRFALENNGYERLLACDYSDSMLVETRSRYVQAEFEARKKNKDTPTPPILDLIRLDVANLPFRTSSIDCLNAAAAMHCWPRLDSGLSEIHRSLEPGGLFFASTFLSRYFSKVGAVNSKDIKKQTFQMFESAESVKEIICKAGFLEEDVEVTLLEPACIIIKAKKAAEGGDDEPLQIDKNETQTDVVTATVVEENELAETTQSPSDDWEVEI